VHETNTLVFCPWFLALGSSFLVLCPCQTPDDALLPTTTDQELRTKDHGEGTSDKELRATCE